MMSLRATSSASCSSCVKATITVKITDVILVTLNKIIGTFFTKIPFLALLCSDFQNYLRTQTGSTTTINVIICTVDYLLRLQVTISSFCLTSVGLRYSYQKLDKNTSKIICFCSVSVTELKGSK